MIVTICTFDGYVSNLIIKKGSNSYHDKFHFLDKIMVMSALHLKTK